MRMTDKQEHESALAMSKRLRELTTFRDHILTELHDVGVVFTTLQLFDVAELVHFQIADAYRLGYIDGVSKQGGD